MIIMTIPFWIIPGNSLKSREIIISFFLIEKVILWIYDLIPLLREITHQGNPLVLQCYTEKSCNIYSIEIYL